jgi:hypothetical protein
LNFRSETKGYENFHSEKKEYVKFHSEIKGRVYFHSKIEGNLDWKCISYVVLEYEGAKINKNKAKHSSNIQSGYL